MPHEIPEPFVWDESFKVFYENLDEEHQGLFAAIFDVTNDPASAANLKKLVDVSQHHFDDEEKMMANAKFDGHDSHKKAHDDFLQKVKGLNVPVPLDQMKWAKEWLVNHIKVTDFKYKGKV